MQDLLSNTSPWEAGVTLLVFLVGWLACGQCRRRFLRFFGLGVILYTTLLRRMPGGLSRPASIARLELSGLNPAGCLWNLLLFVPLGMGLRGRQAWLALLLSAAVEVVQQVTHLGMLDLGDILFNAAGTLVGMGIGCLGEHARLRAKRLSGKEG